METLPDTSPTIDAHINCWHILIGEVNGNLLHNNRNERRVDEKAAKRHCKNLADERLVRGGVLMIEDLKCEQVGLLVGEKWEKMHDISRRVYSPDGLSPTLHTCGGGNLEPKILELIKNKKIRIRKLTPKECFRLQGVKDEDNEIIANNQSNSSQYHLAGDSIITTVLMGIFGQMVDKDYKKYFNKEKWFKERKCQAGKN